MLAVKVFRSLGARRFEFDFCSPAQGVTALFGASGAGKSTALALIAGALEPATGSVSLDGETWFDSAARINHPLHRRGIGWVFQDARLFPHLSVAGNLDFGASRLRQRPLRVQREQVIEVLAIAPLLGRRPQQLSGGERQRVALGRALLAQPRLLLLDEPLAALEAPLRSQIMSFIERIKREFTVPMLYVTHSQAEVLRLADHLLLIDDGRIVAHGRCEELFGHAGVPWLAAREDAGSLLHGRVLRQSEGRASVAVGRQSLQLADAALAAGETLRLFVPANDVILAREVPRAISVRNVLAARIRRLSERDRAVMLVELDCEGATLLAAITRAACEDMRLAEGEPVYALIKSVAIDAPAGRRLATP
ncbi:MAG: molybdenum ABC transporter ATP-binding protein [Steroidobacteraceae bacterium]